LVKLSHAVFLKQREPQVHVSQSSQKQNTTRYGLDVWASTLSIREPSIESRGKHENEISRPGEAGPREKGKEKGKESGIII
jgi:hypothetical protein